MTVKVLCPQRHCQASETQSRPSRRYQSVTCLGLGAGLNLFVDPSKLFGDAIAAYGTDLAGRVVVERRLSFDAMGSGPEASLRELARVINGALAEFAAVGATIAGITVAVPGLVDVATGTVVVAPNLRWYDVPVPRMLSAAGMATVMPVAVDNDANLAALAEYHGGVAAGTPDLVYLTGEV